MNRLGYWPAGIPWTCMYASAPQAKPTFAWGHMLIRQRQEHFLFRNREKFDEASFRYNGHHQVAGIWSLLDPLCYVFFGGRGFFLHSKTSVPWSNVVLLCVFRYEKKVIKVLDRGENKAGCSSSQKGWGQGDPAGLHQKCTWAVMISWPRPSAQKQQSNVFHALKYLTEAVIHGKELRSVIFFTFYLLTTALQIFTVVKSCFVS